MKIGFAQLNTIVGDLRGNFEKSPRLMIVSLPSARILF
jgi:hypothetical protein